jgi:hypothetical protein
MLDESVIPFVVVYDAYKLVEGFFRVPRTWLKVISDHHMRVVERLINPLCWGHVRNSINNRIQERGD